MAHGVEWSGANRRLGAPDGKDETSVYTLPVFTNGMMCVSCWALSDEEIAEVVRTKHIFLGVLSGQTQPPVIIGTEGALRDLAADYGVWKK